METEITVYGPLRSATGDKTVVLEWEGGTVADALAAFVDAYPRAASHLYDGDAVRSSVRVSLGGDRAGLDDQVPEDAALAIVPAVQGGSSE